MHKKYLKKKKKVCIAAMLSRLRISQVIGSDCQNKVCFNVWFYFYLKKFWKATEVLFFKKLDAQLVRTLLTSFKFQCECIFFSIFLIMVWLILNISHKSWFISLSKFWLCWLLEEIPMCLNFCIRYLENILLGAYGLFFPFNFAKNYKKYNFYQGKFN